MKSNSALVEINEPCQVNLDEMSETDCGRMCSVCDVNVYDFTKMTTKQVQKTLQKEPVVCGKFHKRHVASEANSHRFINRLDNFLQKIHLSRLTIIFIGITMLFSSCRKHGGLAGAYVEQPTPNKNKTPEHHKMGKFSRPQN